LIDDLATGLMQAGVNFPLFLATFDLDAEVIQPRLSTTSRDCEIDAGVVQHPFRVVRLDDPRDAWRTGLNKIRWRSQYPRLRRGRACVS
jgi:hypothetical protein